MFRPSALAALSAVFFSLGVALAQQSPAPPEIETQPSDQSMESSEVRPSEALSEAERITRLQRSIAENQKQLEQLKAEVDDPEGEYAQAEAEFSRLDSALEEKRAKLEKIDPEKSPEQAAELEGEISALAEQHDLARERFDLAIKERRTLQEQVAALERTIAQDRSALQQLQAGPRQVPAPQPADMTTAPAAATQPAESPQTSLPVTGMPGAPVPQQQPAAAGEAEPTPTPRKEVIEAQQEAEQAEAVAEQAEEEVRTLEERISALQKRIDLEQEQLVTARKKAENARQTERTLTEQVQAKIAEGAPQDEIQVLWDKIAAARERAQQARKDVNERTDRVEALRNQLSKLQDERIAALQEAEAKRKEAEAAQEKVEKITNPFSPRNMWLWTLDHGPKLLAIIIGMFLLWWLVRLADTRVVKVIALRTRRGSKVERENRAQTLVSVFHNAANVVIATGGILMILTEVGVNIVPLMGGVAVVGLAVAFGAQNLIRDFFYGFMILMENQYGINDVVKIGDNAGLVERITLRVTVLRDLEGIVHFIPNGEVKTVRNMTHGWSRTVFNIGVSYNEDVDHVMKVIMDVAMGLRNDPEFKSKILADPEMLGVDAFADSAVVIMFMVKTKPLQQWAVKRAMLYRLKKEFDAQGIEIPFPHRTVYHRTAEQETPFVHVDAKELGGVGSGSGDGRH